MTRLKFCFSTFAVLIIFMGINSCVKDDLKNENGVDFFTDKRNIAPTIINGMLHFDTYAAFEDYMQELEDLEQDSSQIELAFQQLGVDLSQELLPNLTFFPVCLLREQQISGFISARKTEEDDINNALNAGDTSVFSIISEPYLKSVLNSNFSVHIGTRIFKFFENEGLLIILNNDWNTYYANVSKTTDHIISGPNMVFTSRDKNSWVELYEYNSNGEITVEKTYNGPVVTVA